MRMATALSSRKRARGVKIKITNPSVSVVFKHCDLSHFNMRHAAVVDVDKLVYLKFMKRYAGIIQILTLDGVEASSRL